MNSSGVVKADGGRAQFMSAALLHEVLLFSAWKEGGEGVSHYPFCEGAAVGGFETTITYLPHTLTEHETNNERKKFEMR